MSCRHRFSLGFLLLSALLLPRSVEAAPILDQVVLANGGGVGSGGLAQTFTVGLAGDLVGVDVGAWGDNAGPATFYILGTTGGVPDSSKILLSMVVSIPFATRDPISKYQPTIFFAPISVSIGDQLAVALTGLDGGGINWVQTANPYGGGSMFNIPDGIAANRYVDLSLDGGFRTYVDPIAAVPEPATMTMLGLGLLGAVGRRLVGRKRG